MKFLVGSLLLCAVVHLGQSYCFGKQLEIKPGEEPPTHCVDTEDGTKHAWGSKWRNSKCMDCTCKACCNLIKGTNVITKGGRGKVNGYVLTTAQKRYITPVKIPPDCMMEFDQKNYRYNVFKKNDRTKSCPVLGAVGK
ncbi:beta-microseminoprotein J1-like [Polyodon spathula]|uniref:beta-microseminoprotein J1-like n=1 Tax=Polyodon spathula TaxID=7913 RepID=UPI001B7F75C2|nr:beta-microseminoprotein J1-like [Polyodon spathula]